MKQMEEFDSVLEDALRAYREAEPLAGLEERVLRRLGEKEQPRKTWLTWSLATGLIAATLVVTAWFVLRDSTYRPLVEHSEIVRPPARKTTGPNSTAPLAEILKSAKPDDGSPGTPPETRERPAKRAVKGYSNNNPLALTKPFPTPSPLTQSERNLLTLAKSNPQALRSLPRGDTEIAIAPIEIKPLVADQAGDEGED